MAGRVTLWYVRGLCALLVLQALLGTAGKLAQGRGDDLVHNGLHLVSGLLGLAMVRGARAPEGARRFALGFGLFYAGLGAVGWVWSNPLGLLPLGPADHLFHLAVGGLTLGVGALAATGHKAAAAREARRRAEPSPVPATASPARSQGGD